MNKALIAVLVVLAAGAGFVMFTNMPQSEAVTVTPTNQGETVVAPAALTVTVAPPEWSLWPETVDATGWTAPWQEIVISAEVGGQQIKTLGADVGDIVQRGDLLVELSRETLENDINQLAATLESAQASLDQATSDAERASQLEKSGSGALSQQEAAEYYATERKAKADIASAEAQLASARLNLDRTAIRAASGGVISSRSGVVGAVTSEGEELYRLIRDGRIEWQAEVPLRQLLQIKIDTPVTILTPVGKVTGRVDRIAPSASETNGRVKVYVGLDEPEDGPEPKTGVMIGGFFTTGESEAMHVPSSAVVQQDGFSYVFLLDAEDPTIVRRERVETGRRQGDRVELIGEIATDAQVVQSGGAFLSDGSTVQVSDPATENAGAQAESETVEQEPGQ